jgi:long-chain acyl-CoA synthetase
MAASRQTPQDERERLRKVNAATIVFSSGTTSEAKGIIDSHETLCQRLVMPVEMRSVEERSNLLWLLSNLNHLPGPLSRFFSKGEAVVLADATDIDTITKLVSEYNITQIEAAPLFYRLLLNEPDLAPQNLRRVGYFLSGGNSLPRAVAESFHSRFGCEIVQHYGLTECGTLTLTGKPRRPAHES